MDDFTREVIGRSLFLPPGCQVKKFVFDGTEDFLELSQVPLISMEPVDGVFRRFHMACF
jgi:hypothetical protein